MYSQLPVTAGSTSNTKLGGNAGKRSASGGHAAQPLIPIRPKVDVAATTARRPLRVERRNPHHIAKDAVDASGGANPLLSRLRNAPSTNDVPLGIPHSLTYPQRRVVSPAAGDLRLSDVGNSTSTDPHNVSLTLEEAPQPAAATTTLLPPCNSTSLSAGNAVRSTAAAATHRSLQLYRQPVYTKNQLRELLTAKGAAQTSHVADSSFSYTQRAAAPEGSSDAAGCTLAKLATARSTASFGSNAQQPGRSRDAAADSEAHRVIRGTSVPLFPLVPSNSPKEFTYLSMRPRGLLDAFNPYDLRVVSHSEVDPSNYYTVSAAGVTRYTKNEASFVDLKTWEREHKVFHQLINLDVFRYFKQWRSFFVWRKLVRNVSMRKCSSFLTENLFHIHPILSQTLQYVRTTCLEFLQNNNLYMASSETRTLEQFSAALHGHLNVERSRLDKMIRDLRTEVEHACKVTMSAAVAKREETLAAFANDMKRKKKASEAFDAVDEHRPSYIELSHKRAVCARLTAFIRLCDYIIIYCLTHLASKAMDDIRHDLDYHQRNFTNLTPQRMRSTGGHLSTPSSENRSLLVTSGGGRVSERSRWDTPSASIVAPMGNPATHTSAVARGRRRSDKQVTTSQSHPLLVADISYNVDTGEIELLPSLSSISQCFEEIVKDYVKTVSSIPRLVLMDVFKTYTENVSEDGRDEVGPGPDVGEMVVTEESFRTNMIAIRSSIASAFGEMEMYAREFEAYKIMYEENQQLDSAKIRESNPPLDFFRNRLALYKSQMEAVRSKIPNTREVALFLVRTEALREFMSPSPAACLDALHELLPVIARDQNEALLADMQSCNTRMSVAPKSVEQYVELLSYHRDVEQRFDALAASFDFIRELFALVQEEKVPVSEEDEETFRSGTRPQFDKLRTLLQVFEDAKEAQQRHFSRNIDDQVEGLKHRIEGLINKAAQPIVSDVEASIDDAMAYMTDLQRDAEEVAEREKQLRKFQGEIGVEETPIEMLGTMMADVHVKTRLWTSAREWEQLTTENSAVPFATMDIAPVQEAIQKFVGVVKQVTAKLPKNLAATRLRSNVEEWRQLSPIFTALKNPNLKPEHNARISSIIGKIDDGEGNMRTIADMDRTFTIGMLVKNQVLRFKDEILGVSLAATEEEKLQQGIDKVNALWNGGGPKPALELQFNSHKDQRDAYVLTGNSIEEVTALLEDSMVSISTLGSSKHCQGVLRVQVDRWEMRLQYMGQLLEQWVEFQRNWIYLENIFSSSEIRNQWKDDAKRFEKADRFYRDFMRRARDMPNAFRALLINAPSFELGDAKSAGRSLRQDFENFIKELEKVLASLERRLEEKRRAFPRFYFLSNDDLLDILAKVKTPELIMTHMLKMFDGVKTLAFSENNEITHLVSLEGERVELANKSIKARGPVEFWIDSLEQEMFVTLRKLARACLEDHESVSDKGEWMFRHPVQLVLIMEQIYWTRSVEEALDREDSYEMMQLLKEANYRQLEELAGLTSLKLSKVQRILLSTLITIDVHGRDLVAEMCDNEVLHSTEFGWAKQMRAYWEQDEDGYGNIFIRQNNSRFKYGYEYLGAQGRLVITPLTDRIYMTITGALRLYLGAAPAGPAGTGKTETVKDLAKNMARQCIVYNCSDGVTYKMMEKFFAGLIQTGAWTCLDEFNRINVEVLSVIASQVLEIKMALQSGAETFTFQGTPDVRVRPTYGAFITMNPGYAGRTELPDNLKILFRPVAVMTPDFRMIAEVILYSEGFTNAKELSLKITQLYKLSSEQLSPQDHYDFGMRALKSILVMAGDLKRSQPDVEEDLTLIVACNNSNVPKFVAEDIPLFRGIMQDLFPGSTFPEKQYTELLPALLEDMRTKSLVPQESWLKKNIEFYETLVVRHGVMLVGVTGTGKTEARLCVACALSMMAEMGSQDPMARPVHQFLMNPKAITMSELYGQVDPNTNEWRDGVLAVTAKNCVRDADRNKDHRWIVFDGPVDTLWIESLNSVLDDSKLLCLDSGERIKLPDTIHMLFEVADLSVASPATVSRCGMVYVDREDLSWRSVVGRWANTKLAKTSAEPLCREYIVKLFENNMQKALDWYAQHKGLIDAGPLNLVQSACDLFAAMMVVNSVELTPDPPAGTSVHVNDPSLRTRNEMCHLLFVFSVIWSVGGNVELLAQEQFDVFVRSTYEALVRFPSAGSVFDYTIDFSSRLFTSWEGKVKPFQFDPRIPFFNILVPTVDTVRLSTIAETLVRYGKPLLFCGPSGVGKSVIMADCLHSKKEELKLTIAEFQFSAQTSSERTQELIEAKLRHKRKNLLGAAPGYQVVMFIDDLNMPALEVFGASPPIELVRQMMGCGGFYDRKVAGFWKTVEDVTVVAACGPPEGGRNPLTPRLSRLFHLLQVPTLNEDSMKRIFFSILKGFFDSKSFSHEVRDLCKNMVTASVEVFMKIRAELRPRHSTPHYTFNLRDLAKVFQGMMQVTPRICKESGTAVRLWVHENTRCFYDRLVSAEDRRYFTEEVMMDSITRLFPGSFTHEELFERDPIIWGDFLRIGASERVYEEATDFAGVANILDQYQDDYNSTLGSSKDHDSESISATLNLVFFKDHCEHLARIVRTLRQPRGNALLVGVGGSGKQSLTRLAASIAECKRFEVSVGKGFSMNDFHEFLLELYTHAGVRCVPSVFLISDAQIVHDTMLEDINGMLNSGEVPSLFTQEEREKRINACLEAAREHGITQRDDVFNFFISRVRDNMHIVLCMSPVGDTFRSRCRQFPSLTNCCAIDWFDGWPREALLGVAHRLMADDQQHGSGSGEKATSTLSSQGGGESVSTHAKAGKRSARRKSALSGKGHAEPPSIPRRGSSASEAAPEESDHAQLLTELCVDVHQAVVEVAQEYWDELRRRYYITPTSFLEFIKLYKYTLIQKRETLLAQFNRLSNGKSKMKETDETIAVMKAEIEEKRPLLEVASKETQEVVADLMVRQTSAQEVQVRVKAQQETAVEQQRHASKIAAEAKAKLDEAKPIIEKAKAALDTIQASDLNELRSLANPPSAVLKTAQACMVMFDPKDFGGAWSGSTDWKGAREFLSYRPLLDMIRNYPTDNVKPTVLQKVNKFISDDEFTVEICSTKGSMTCGSLCAWVHAVNAYSKVVKEVAPMRAAAAEAEANLAETNERLNAAQAELKRVQDELSQLQKTYEASLKRKNDLEHGLQVCISRLQNAETLSACLQSEAVRWEENIHLLQGQLKELAVTTFISCACVAYCGAFTPQFRRRLVAKWVAKMDSKGLNVQSFSLNKSLGDPVDILNWQINGLPTDESSTESAIIASLSVPPWRWPLLIDPQEQGVKWLTKQFGGVPPSDANPAPDGSSATRKGKSPLRVIRLTDPTWMRTLEMQIRTGGVVILDDVGETLDPALEPLLQRSIFVADGGGPQIQLTPQSGLIDYNPSFRFFMCTKLPNPCYLPDISTKITLLNFTVTMEGLTEQMLGEVVSVEKRELEEEKNSIINSISQGKQKLKAIEETILAKLQNTKGNILDDRDLIAELKSAQSNAVVLGEQQRVAEEKMEIITTARNQYREVAARASVLFFVLADMSRIDPMYQYSLQYFQNVVHHVLETTQKPKELPAVEDEADGPGDSEAALLALHLQNLMRCLSETTYTQVCRGLFNRDKLILSLLMSTSIALANKDISDEEWQYFVRASALVTGELPPLPPSLSWLSRVQWELATTLQRTVTCFDELIDDMLLNPSEWKRFIQSEAPHDEPLPAPVVAQEAEEQQPDEEQPAHGVSWEADLTPFQRVLLIRCFREEKLFFALRKYVANAMGAMYTEAPPFSLESAITDSSPRTPIVFILSQGVDPLETLQVYATSQGHELQCISLGQGQGENAKKLIERCRKSGAWALLQNCHLSKTFMGELTVQVANLVQFPNETHPKFRLWLTSMPTDFFPVFVLQSSVKLTNEPPTGLKANMVRCYGAMTDEDVDYFSRGEMFDDGMPKSEAYKKLLYGLSFFHSVVIERKKYGPLGWNVKYEWNDTDFHASKQWLQLFLSEQNLIPWESIEYVIGQINYGGRVTDPQDRFTLQTILRIYLCEEVLQENYSFSASGTYRVPPAGSLDFFNTFLSEMSQIDDPEVFGMGTNANLRHQLQVSQGMLNTVLSIQPRLISVSGGGMSPEELVKQRCKDFEASLPPNILREEAGPTSFTMLSSGLPNSMSTVLSHEVTKYNKLLDVIRASLGDLQKALKGLTLISADLDKMYDAFLSDRVPALWSAASYSSLKPLGAWYREFLERIAFIRTWVRKGEPTAFWISGFFNPSAFMTGCFQAFARAEAVSVDKLGFSFNVLDREQHEVTSRPERGCYVYGIFTDSWRWEKEKRVMAEALPAEPTSVLPVVHFLPEPHHKTPPSSHCVPMYRTMLRAGIISSLGASSNYVMSLEIPTDKTPDFWRLMGAACVCSLDT